MPYIITTRTTVPGWKGDGAVATRSRHTVATLEDAWNRIVADLGDPFTVEIVRQRIGVDGGTLGPMNDLSVIEVQSV